MKILADENFPWAAVQALRELGHDVVWVKETSPSISDSDVLTWAVREARILVTQDKDFGELAYRAKRQLPPGLVLFRMPPVPSLIAAYAKRIFGEGAKLHDLFVVVESARIRERKLRS